MLGGMAPKWRWRKRAARGGQADRPAEHGLRPGAGGVAQVRQVLGHRDARGADAPGRTTRWTPTTCWRGCDENTIMVVPTFGVTYTGAYELVSRDRRRARRRCRRDTGLDIDIHVDGASGGVPRPVLRAGPRVGLPAAAGEVDQHVGPQVRPGAARRRLGRVARRGRAARRPDLPRRLPRRRHAGVPDQLLAGPAARSSRSTTTSSARPRGLPPHPQACVDTGRFLAGRDRRAGPVRADLRQQRRAPGGRLEAARTGDAGYTLYDLADRLRMRGWQVAAYPLPADRAATRSCSASWSVRASAATWRTLLADDIRSAIAHFASHPVPHTAEHRPGYQLKLGTHGRTTFLSFAQPRPLHRPFLRARVRPPDRPRLARILLAGSTAGSLLVALLVGALAFAAGGVRSRSPISVGRSSWRCSPMRSGSASGPQFVDGLRQEGVQLIMLVMVTTTLAFGIAYGGSRLFGLAPGFAPGILSGSNTISAVMGVATRGRTGAVSRAGRADGRTGESQHRRGLFADLHPLDPGIVLLVRNLPALFGSIRSPPRGRAKRTAQGPCAARHQPGVRLGVMPKVDVRVFQLSNTTS